MYIYIYIHIYICIYKGLSLLPQVDADANILSTRYEKTIEPHSVCSETGL